MTVETLSSAAQNPETSPLRATIEIEPDGGAMCSVATEAPNAAAVTRSYGESDGCHSEVTTLEGGESERTYLSVSQGDRCVCEIIGRFDCVYDVEGIRNGTLVVGLVVEDRRLLGRIVDGLERNGATVQLRRLSHLSDSGNTVLEIEATNITSKQREAVELAVELGYYDRPRNAALSDIADRLDISRSAVSQRLNAVELTLIRSFVDE